MTAYPIFKVYDAINENPEAPNIDFPDDPDEKKAIIDFNACKKFDLQNNLPTSISNITFKTFLSAGGATADKWMTVTSSQWLCKFSCPKIVQIRAY